MNHLHATSEILENGKSENNQSSQLTLACAKRTPVERRGIHSWHPYYAGYSEAFVKSAFEFLGANNTSVLLDPWGGSGTTAIVAAQKGMNCISVDINPVMATFAAAKSYLALHQRSKIEGFFNSKKWDFSPLPGISRPSEIYTPQTTQILSQVISAINSDPSLCVIENNTLAPNYTNALENTRHLSPLVAFGQAALFIAMRQLIGPVRLTNPTWIRRQQQPLSVESDTLISQLPRTLLGMLSDLQNFYGDSEKKGNIISLTEDVRNLPLKSESVDHIVTSPPYLTRIDYAVSTLPELEILGGKDFVYQIRHLTTGAPIITQAVKKENPTWGETCIRVLNEIRNHGTQAAAGYYWKNITQYFMDIEQSMRELCRVLKRDGTGLLVVQSSYFKDIEIPLGEIFVEMARNIGFESSIVSRQVVRGHMAHKNKRSNAYKNNKVYFEDVVRIRKY